MSQRAFFQSHRIYSLEDQAVSVESFQHKHFDDVGLANVAFGVLRRSFGLLEQRPAASQIPALSVNRSQRSNQRRAWHIPLLLLLSLLLLYLLLLMLLLLRMTQITHAHPAGALRYSVGIYSRTIRRSYKNCHNFSHLLAVVAPVMDCRSFIRGIKNNDTVLLWHSCDNSNDILSHFALPD